jgi:transcriptional regulator with XRE-family HTH domain
MPPLLLAQSIVVTVAKSVVQGRNALGWSRRELARRTKLSRQLIDHVEQAAMMPSLNTVARLFDALGIDAELMVRAPFLIDGDRQRDVVHAQCSAYVQRRLETNGLAVDREVEVVHGRSHGWIDLLAFAPRSRTALAIEVKTPLDDLGRIERTIGWYEREAWTACRRRGRRPRQVVSWLLVLATAAVEDRLAANREAIAHAFPDRAPAMQAWLSEPSSTKLRGRGVALVDPRSRRRGWLLRCRIDGRRGAPPYLDYADFVRSRLIGIATRA